MKLTQESKLQLYKQQLLGLVTIGLKKLYQPRYALPLLAILAFISIFLGQFASVQFRQYQVLTQRFEYLVNHPEGMIAIRNIRLPNPNPHLQDPDKEEKDERKALIALMKRDREREMHPVPGQLACDLYINTLAWSSDEAPLLFMSMYDPGQCLKVPDPFVLENKDGRKEEGGKEEEEDNPVYGMLDPTVFNRCQDIMSGVADDEDYTHLSEPRLCRGMIRTYTYKDAPSQRYSYSSEAYTRAIQQLGEACFNKSLNILVSPGDLEPQSPHRLTFNNLFSALRLVRKPFTLNSLETNKFDMTLQLSQTPLMTSLLRDMSSCRGYWLGPTITSPLDQGISWRCITMELSTFTWVGYKPPPKIRSKRQFPLFVDTFYFKPSSVAETKTRQGIIVVSDVDNCDTSLLKLTLGTLVDSGYDVMKEIEYLLPLDAALRDLARDAAVVVFCGKSWSHVTLVYSLAAMNLAVIQVNRDTTLPLVHHAVADPSDATSNQVIAALEMAGSSRTDVHKRFSLFSSAIGLMRNFCAN